MLLRSFLPRFRGVPPTPSLGSLGRAGKPVRRGIIRRAGDNRPAFEPPDWNEMARSKLLNSGVVQNEVQEIMKQFVSVTSLFPKFFDWDVAGQRYYLSELDTMSARIETFLFRAKLTDDPAAKQIINMLNIQTAMRQQKDNLSRVVDELERIEISGDVERLVLTKRMLKEQAQQAPGAGVDYSKLVSDPEVGPALQDPQVLTAYNDVLRDPANVKKYVDNPRIMGLLKKMGLVK